MGKHRVPEPKDGDVLGLAPQYKGGVMRGKEHQYDFEDWWESYVTAPIAAANAEPETKIIPLTKNMPVLQEDDNADNEVNMWRVFAYIIMGGLCAVLVFYALAAFLAVIFLAIVVGVAWLGVRR